MEIAAKEHTTFMESYDKGNHSITTTEDSQRTQIREYGQGSKNTQEVQELRNKISQLEQKLTEQEESSRKQRKISALLLKRTKRYESHLKVVMQHVKELQYKTRNLEWDLEETTQNLQDIRDEVDEHNNKLLNMDPENQEIDDFHDANY